MKKALLAASIALLSSGYGYAADPTTYYPIDALKGNDASNTANNSMNTSTTSTFSTSTASAASKLAGTVSNVSIQGIGNTATISSSANGASGASANGASGGTGGGTVSAAAGSFSVSNAMTGVGQSAVGITVAAQNSGAASLQQLSVNVQPNTNFGH